MTLSRTALLALAATFALACSSFTAQASIVVASEDFSSVLNPITSGPDNNPGRWEPTGYAHTGVGDTEANMNTLNLFVDQRIAGDTGPNPVGWYKGNDASGNNIHMGAIKMFVDASGTPITANPGDTISGSFETFFDKGRMSFGLVTDVAALKASQNAVSISGPQLPVGVSTLNGGAYFGGITGVIDITPSGNTTINRIYNNAGFAAADGLVHSSTGGFGQLVASGNLAGWQRIFFDYVVGDSIYTAVGYEQFIDDQNPGLGTVFGTIEDNGSVPIDIGTAAPGQVVGFFISGNGDSDGVTGISEHFYDNILITVDRIPEPGVLALMGIGALVVYRFRRRR